MKTEKKMAGNSKEKKTINFNHKKGFPNSKKFKKNAIPR